MKTGKLAAFILLAGLATACGSKEGDESETQGTPIDTSVVGIDTNAVDTRQGIELSDPEKQTLPGRDTTNSDEPKK